MIPKRYRLVRSAPSPRFVPVEVAERGGSDVDGDGDLVISCSPASSTNDTSIFFFSEARRLFCSSVALLRLQNVTGMTDVEGWELQNKATRRGRPVAGEQVTTLYLTVSQWAGGSCPLARSFRSSPPAITRET